MYFNNYVCIILHEEKNSRKGKSVTIARSVAYVTAAASKRLMHAQVTSSIPPQ